MATILFLAHRMPYPPNKGDKIRSWNFLNHLTRHHAIHLGYFLDDIQDAQYRQSLGLLSLSQFDRHVSPLAQKFLALRAFFSGEALSVAAYPMAKLRTYVKDLLDSGDIDLIFLYSGVMAAALPVDCETPVILDFVDVDSAKWAAYAEDAKWPLKNIYKMEAERLSAFEKNMANRWDTSLFVSDAEATLFKEQEGVIAKDVRGITNGVDLEHFNPDLLRQERTPRLIFTGAMNYKPNIDAVCWYAREVFPQVKTAISNAEFVIAGSPVADAVHALSKIDGVRVTGFVQDMTDELGAARIAVAPLFTARGIQNKVLEAMAMGLPVITSSGGAQGIYPVDRSTNAEPPFLIEDDVQGFARASIQLLQDQERAIRLGSAARVYVEKYFSWDSSMRELDSLIAKLLDRRRV